MKSTHSSDRPNALMRFTAILPAIQRGYRSVADKAVAPHGVSQASAMPLLTISRMGESVRLGVLAEAIGLEGASLTRLIEQLCASGLATRRDDPEDGRARTLHLTDEGRACAARIEGAMDEVRATLFKDVSDADLAACLRVFAQLGERLGGSMPAVIARAIDPATGSDGAT